MVSEVGKRKRSSVHTMSPPRCVEPAREHDAHEAIRYLEDVAHELRSRGLLVATLDVRAGARLAGSLQVTDEPDAAARGGLTLHWHARSGWWTQRASRRSRRRVRCLIGDPDVAPATVACLAADLLT